MTDDSRPGAESDLSLLRAVASAPASAPPVKLEGTRVGRYLVEEKIGQGGMGVVYSAHDDKLGRKVALKVLPAALLYDPERTKRFLREARAAAALSHPNVAAIYEVDEHEGAPFIAMELVDGEPLSTIVARRVAMADARRLALDVARGLAKAHASGVIHRDLKPANVRVTKDGVAKLLDFGLARLLAPDAPMASSLTAEGTLVGTPAYMAPEQVEGKPTDARSDVFSFGVLLCELLTGALPWRAKSASAMVAAVLRDDAAPALTNADLDPSLVAVALRCLEKEPARRYQNGGEIVAALETVGAAPSRPARVPFWHRRPRSTAAAAFVLGALVSTGECSVDEETAATEAAVPALRNVQRLTDADGVEDEPTISPDGKQVVYVAAGDGFADLYSVRAGGARAINLTHSPEEERMPAFSPDGERIAYVAGIEPASSIFLIGATGESRTKLVDGGYHPAWSPDGREIFYSTATWVDANERASDGEIWAVDVASGARRKVAGKDGAQPSVSPDGKHVAYWRNENGRRDLMIVAAAGGEGRAVTHDAPLDYNPIWSADGRALFFLSDRGGERNLWQVHVNTDGTEVGDAPVIVVGGPARLNRMAIASTERVVASVAGSVCSVLRLPADAAGVPRGEPEFVFSSSRQILVTDASATARSLALHEAEPSDDVAIGSMDGTERRRLSTDADKQRYPRLTPAGDRMLYYSNAGGRWRPWIVRTDGSDAKPIDVPPGVRELVEVMWSPDTRRIAGYSILDRTSAIVELDDAGRATSLRVLVAGADGRASFRPTDFSPDGMHLVGAVEQADSFVGIGFFELASGALRVVPLSGAGARITPPRYTADAEHIVYARLPSEVVVMDVRSEKETVVYRTPRGATAQLVVAAADGTLWITTEQLRADLWLMDLESASSAEDE